MTIEKSRTEEVVREPRESAEEAKDTTAILTERSRDLLAAEAYSNGNSCRSIVSDKTRFTTLDELKFASKEELDCLYNNSSAGKIPEGETKGIPLFLPGTTLGDIVNQVGSLVWHGKVFDHGNLTNEILNTHLFNAKVEQGQSWTNSNSAIVIDYQKGQKALSDHLTSWIRDEIREIRPGIYLGQLHNQGLPLISKASNLTYFALDAKQK